MVYWYMIHLTFLSCCLLWQKHLTIAGFRQPMGHHCISLNVINFPRPVERKPAHSWLYSWLCLFLSMFSSVQSLSRVRLFTTPWTAACHTSLSITNSRSSLRLSPSSQWCHPAISSSVVPFSSCPQSLPASESFPMSQVFSWGGQSTGVSASASFPPKTSQGWSPSEWTRG